MSTRDLSTRPAAGEYSTEKDNQLQPEDTLVDRGLDDMLDVGYSPPERPYGHGQRRSLAADRNRRVREQ